MRIARAAMRPLWSAITLLLVLTTLTGCAVRFAPSPDRSLIDGLAKANEEAMTLFASVASGTTAATFASRERSYDTLLGKFDALRLQAQVRPNPRPLAGFTLMFSINATTQERADEAAAAPTSDVLAAIIKTLTMMRETDRKTGLAAIVVQNFKREFEISMQQALTYEKALER